MIPPLLQGAIQPALNMDETSIYAWIMGYVILLICSCQLVAYKLQRNWREMRSALYWQLGWTLLLLMFPPIAAPLVWSPVALSWIILGFLFSLDITGAQSRRSLHHQRGGARQRKRGEQASSLVRSPLPPQQQGADDDG